MGNVLRFLDGPSGKRWDSAADCFADHAMFLTSHRTLFGAYTGLGSPAVAHDTVEAVMVTVNSVNQCPYCDGLHGELARMAGVDGAPKLRSGDFGGVDAKHAAAVTYARVCGEEDGRGTREADALAKLSTAEGAGRAASIKALSLFLMWGSMVGNTVNFTKKRFLLLEPLTDLTLFNLAFIAYYGPLFFLVFVVNTVLKFLPSIPAQVWFFKLMGCVLWCLALLWIFPVGLTALIFCKARPSGGLRGKSAGPKAD